MIKKSIPLVENHPFPLWSASPESEIAERWWREWRKTTFAKNYNPRNESERRKWNKDFSQSEKRMDFWKNNNSGVVKKFNPRHDISWKDKKDWIKWFKKKWWNWNKKYAKKARSNIVNSKKKAEEKEKKFEKK